MKYKRFILFIILFLLNYLLASKENNSGSTVTSLQINRQYKNETTEYLIKNNNTTVRTKYFSVTGRKYNVQGYTGIQFLGIPFAYPHNSSRRFLPPLPINENTFNTSKDSHFVNGSYQAFTPANTCPQYLYITGFNGSDMLLPTNNITEDCLQLNMWMPDNRTSHNLSTIVFLYGGSFATGSASIDVYNGSVLAAKEKLIVITLNYRVGPLGFAYFGEDTEAKGNAGLLDQQLGLQWIYENIDYFGGNSSDITLFGESAGAASVTAHLLSNKSHPYFSKIIANSGAITNVWATVPSYVALNNTLWLSSIMNCTNATDFKKLTKENKTDIIKCMQEANTTLLNDNQFTTRDKEQPPFPYTFLPMYNDTVFFNGSLFEKLQKGEVKKSIPSLYGRTAQEGSYFMPFMLGDKYGCGYNYSLPSTDPKNQCDKISGFTVFGSWFLLGNFYKLSYWEDFKLGWIYSAYAHERNNRDKMITIIGDFLFNCDNVNFAMKSNENDTNSSVYFFEFQKRSTINPWPQWMGAMHGYELEYVFGMPYRYAFTRYNMSEITYELKYADKVMKFYGNFAKYGYPNSTWLPFKRNNETTFNNTRCAILHRNFYRQEHVYNYTDVLTGKCVSLNQYAANHYPRKET